MIMVTHHVEEIPAGFTHALLLADGRIHAAGPISEVITGERRRRSWSDAEKARLASSELRALERGLEILERLPR